MHHTIPHRGRKCQAASSHFMLPVSSFRFSTANFSHGAQCAPKGAVRADGRVVGAGDGAGHKTVPWVSHGYRRRPRCVCVGRGGCRMKDPSGLNSATPSEPSEVGGANMSQSSWTLQWGGGCGVRPQPPHGPPTVLGPWEGVRRRGHAVIPQRTAVPNACTPSGCPPPLGPAISHRPHRDPGRGGGGGAVEAPGAQGPRASRPLYLCVSCLSPTGNDCPYSSLSDSCSLWSATQIMAWNCEG